VIFVPSSMPWPAADALPAGPEAAADAGGATDGVPADPAADGLGVALVPHAEASKTKTTARAGNLNWYRIPCLLHVGPDGLTSGDHRFADLGPAGTLAQRNRVRTFVCITQHGRFAPGRGMAQQGRQIDDG
jgi:hypothetical protein